MLTIMRVHKLVLRKNWTQQKADGSFTIFYLPLLLIGVSLSSHGTKGTLWLFFLSHHISWVSFDGNVHWSLVVHEWKSYRAVNLRHRLGYSVVSAWNYSWSNRVLSVDIVYVCALFPADWTVEVACLLVKLPLSSIEDALQLIVAERPDVSVDVTV